MTDEHALKAAALLREDAPLDAAEQAAQRVIAEAKWILAHAGDRDLAVIRLLNRAGLLRDLEHEAHLRRSLASNRALAEQENAACRRRVGILDGIVTETLGALRDGRDPALLAEQIEAAYKRTRKAGGLQ